MSTTTAYWPSDQNLYADGMIYRRGEWIHTAEWIAHSGLALPKDWLEVAVESRAPEEKFARYLAAATAPNRERIRFNPPRERDRNGWLVQTIKGKAPLAINADLREFFEDLTPGSSWWMTPMEMRLRGAAFVGHQISRVHPTLGVRGIVAGIDPRYTP